MKKHIITFGTLLLLAASSFALRAQDDAVAARLAARRAAEAAGDTGAAAQPAAGETTATPAQDAAAAPAQDATTNTVSPGEAAGTNAAAAVDEDEVRRRAAIAAALKEAETNLSAMPANQAAGLKIITQRNIFDPRRRPGFIAEPRQTAPPVLVEAFYLTGTEDKIGKGYAATFAGSGIPTYPPYRCIGETVNGFKIKDITWNSVTLVDARSTASNAEVVLEPTKGLTRTDGGPWRTAYSEITYTTAAPRTARMDGSEPPQVYQPALMQPDFTQPDTFAAQDDGTTTTRQRGRGRQRGGGGGGAGGGGFGGGAGGFGGGAGGFGGGAGGFGGGGNNAFAPPQPAAPPDPNVLRALQDRRAREQ